MEDNQEQWEKPFHQKLKELQRALIDAFPGKSLLERLLFYGLGKNLDEITRDSDLQEIVFNLIRTAKAEGWLVDLVYAAREENPGNSQLRAVANTLLSPSASSAEPRSPTNERNE